MMKSILGNLFDRHAPKISKKVRGKPAPWLNSEVKRLMNERDRLLTNQVALKVKQAYQRINVCVTK